MIQMQIKNRHVKQLALDGTAPELIKELALGVTFALDKFDVKDESGVKIPLSQIVTEFGQFLSLMAQHNSKELDGEE